MQAPSQRNKGSPQLKRHVDCMHQSLRRDVMTSSTKAPTLEEFRARAALTGLTLTEEDIGHLHKGYVGLLGLMERIPERWAWAAEPPQVFRADE
jgi:hypothetical protein